MATNGNIKNDQCTFTLNAYPSNQLDVINHANGIAITNAINNNSANSLYNIFKIPITDAPNTLRIPISFFRCKAVKDASPNNPRQATKIANIVKTLNTFPNF